MRETGRAAWVEPGARFAAGNARVVVDAACSAAHGTGTGVLALVLETEGSTYARAGAMAFFSADTQAGWLSGGCLEPALAIRAAQADASGHLAWVEIDTRADEDLLAGSALGCRGRLRIALVPLRQLPGVDGVFGRWLGGGRTLQRRVHADGTVELDAGGGPVRWALPPAPVPWEAVTRAWDLALPPPPELLLLGGGPETPVLVALLRALGWRTTLVERRARWRTPATAPDTHLALSSAVALQQVDTVDAALTMHHDFELDREALAALAATRIPFVGLLGPRQRRDDLFKLLSPQQRAALEPRLRSPVGLDLGGTGPEAIALSIAAQLQAWRTGRRPAG